MNDRTKVFITVFLFSVFLISFSSAIIPSSASSISGYIPFGGSSSVSRGMENLFAPFEGLINGFVNVVMRFVGQQNSLTFVILIFMYLIFEIALSSEIIKKTLFASNDEKQKKYSKLLAILLALITFIPLRNKIGTIINIYGVLLGVLINIFIYGATFYGTYKIYENKPDSGGNSLFSNDEKAHHSNATKYFFMMLSVLIGYTLISFVDKIFIPSSASLNFISPIILSFFNFVNMFMFILLFISVFGVILSIFEIASDFSFKHGTKLRYDRKKEYSNLITDLEDTLNRNEQKRLKSSSDLEIEKNKYDTELKDSLKKLKDSELALKKVVDDINSLETEKENEVNDVLRESGQNVDNLIEPNPVNREDSEELKKLKTDLANLQSQYNSLEQSIEDKHNNASAQLNAHIEENKANFREIMKLLKESGNVEDQIENLSAKIDTIGNIAVDALSQNELNQRLDALVRTQEELSRNIDYLAQKNVVGTSKTISKLNEEGSLINDEVNAKKKVISELINLIAKIKEKKIEEENNNNNKKENNKTKKEEKNKNKKEKKVENNSSKSQVLTSSNMNNLLEVVSQYKKIINNIKNIKRDLSPGTPLYMFFINNIGQVHLFLDELVNELNDQIKLITFFLKGNISLDELNNSIILNNKKRLKSLNNYFGDFKKIITLIESNKLTESSKFKNFSKLVLEPKLKNEIISQLKYFNSAYVHQMKLSNYISKLK